jgi:hypothetical protein
MYERLPSSIRGRARKTFRLFLANPNHPSLRFKPLQHVEELWSVRITLSYRAVCRRRGDNRYWFWIGTHADFDRDFA